MKITEKKTKKIDIRVTDSMYEVLEFYAESNGMTVSQYVRMYLEFICIQIEEQEEGSRLS